MASVRISLKPTTRMSLNERFQRLRQNQSRQQTNAFTANKMAQKVSRFQLRQGSQKNRRLALQMANRPSVLAALRANQNNQTIQQRSRPIKQRLGLRRGMANQEVVGNQNRVQNKTRFRLNRNFNANNGLNRNRNVNNRNRNLNNRRNNTQNIGVVVGVRRKGLQRKGFRPNLKSGPNLTALKARRRTGQPIRNQSQVKGVVKKRFQLNRNFNARNNQTKPQKRRNVKPNKEQLDKDLDAYMAGTKTHLDAELDAYMSQTI